MSIEVKVPELSESVQSGTLLEWRRSAGDRVSRDEVLADLETDKVILEVTAPAAGVLGELRVPAGTEVKAGEVLAMIDTESAGGEESSPPPGMQMKPDSVAELDDAHASPSPPILLSEGEGGGVREEDGEADDLPSLSDTPSASAPRPPECPPCPPCDLPGERAERRVQMSRLRSRIAERMVEAQRTAAILTTFNEIDMQPVQDLRRRYQERFQREHGVKLGLMSFFVKAASLALKAYPVVNARVDGRDIVYHDFYDIGVAVSSERGLVVPILRDADGLGFADIEQRIVDFARRANALQLSLEELEGGTFTISNGGVFGSLLSTPILNPPQSGVLGLHRIQDRPVAVDGQVVIRPMMYVALSYDHRIVDGRDAVSFLRAVKEALEDPAGLMLAL